MLTKRPTMKTPADVKRNVIVFPLACLAAVAMIFISEGSYWQSVRTLDDLGSMGVARVTILGLEQGVLAAETAQRGYLLTSRTEYLQPYQAALRNIEHSFQSLAQLYQDEAEQTALLGKMKAVTQSKLSELALTLQLHDQGKSETARELLLTNIGKEQLESIRQLSAEMLKRQSAAVTQGRAEVYRTLLLSRVGVAALSAISLLALALYLRQTFALKVQQQQLKQAVQAERDQLEVEVIKRTEELTELARHLQTAREDERSHLARDLHDELGALLTSAKLDAARIRSRLGDTAPEAQERLRHLVSALNSGIALKRRIIEDLRPSALSNLGLVETLGILAREFADRSGIDVVSVLEPVALAPTSELVVYRVVQEAITNISKYAQARHVWITLAQSNHEVLIQIRDDGVGFDPTRLLTSVHGLLGMRFRVEAERGAMVLKAHPGAGTLIEVRLPALSDPS